MRRIVAFLLVAVIAFAAGAAGANGTLTRLLADAGVRVGPTLYPTPPATTAALPGVGAPSTAAGGLSGPSATPARATYASPATATAAPSPASSPSPSPSPSPTPSRIPAPSSPLSLDQQAPGGARVATGAWTGAAGLTLQIMAPATTMDMRAEVEVRPAGEPFSGVKTAAAPVIQGVASIPLHGLTAGRYHWQARLTSAAGYGPWAPYRHGATAFGVQLVPPAAPVASSPTDPRPGATYATSTATFAWSMPSDPSGIAGFSYRLDRDPHGQAPRTMRTRAQQASIGHLDTGRYYFHVRAVDHVGNWGPSTTFPVHIDVTAPELIHKRISGYYFNPAVESLRLSYTLTKVARVTIGIYNAAGVRVRHIVPKNLMPAHVPLKVVWDGRDNAGNVVPPGSYGIWLRATDRLGNVSLTPWNYYHVTARRIVVSLSQQRLWAYDGHQLVLTTLVTTGNRALPTPTGVFHILFRRHPFTFISPEPRRSKYWYPPSPVKYALYFHDYGYYIHDAPWRGVFGPGSNAGVGTPGTNYTGSHGCVNVPSNVMPQLYQWAVPGTAVQINP